MKGKFNPQRIENFGASPQEGGRNPLSVHREDGEVHGKRKKAGDSPRGGGRSSLSVLSRPQGGEISLAEVHE